MKTYNLIARKQVVIDIATGKQKTEERTYSEYYLKRFKDFSLPCRFKLRGGYNKDALFVEIEVKSHYIKDYHNNWLDRVFGTVEQSIIFELGDVLDTNVE